MDADARWPRTGGEMAVRIRDHDWSGTALGPIEGWSERLRAIVDLVLASSQAMAIHCAADGIMLYNDASASYLGPHHPAALGKSARAVFGERRPELLAALAKAMAGSPAQILTRAAPEDPIAETPVFDTYLTPVRDEFGAVILVHAIGFDVRPRLVGEAALRRREAFDRAELEQRVDAATAELKASRDLLQATMDSSQDYIQVFEAIRDETGAIVDFRWVLNNHTSEARYGDVRGESLLSRNPGVLQEGIFACFCRVTETGRSEQMERFYTHENFHGWFHQTVVKLNDGVATTSKDISSWKSAQAEVLRLQEEAARSELEASEERFRSFAEHSPDVLWILDARTLRPTYLGPAFDRVWGRSRDDLLSGMVRWEALIHPEDRGEAIGVLPRAAEGERISMSYRIVRASDGVVRWIEDMGFPIRDSQGRITHIAGIGRDVTMLREASERLRENERRLWAVIRGIPQLVWRADDDGRWIWASPQWGDYTGQTQEESRDFGWLNALHPADRERARAGWMQGDRPETIEMETRLFHCAEQRYRWFQTRALPVRDENGAVTEWLGTSTDVDDLFQLRERQQILVAELQHRTRNLIGVVRSIADNTAAGSSSLRDFVPRYRERLGSLSRINTLLSQLDHGERVAFDELLRTEFEARGVLDGPFAGRVVLDGPEGIRLRSATVQVLALALHELTTNAMKYGALGCPGGSLRVSWRLGLGEKGEERLGVEWIERGVEDIPAPDDPPRGGGFGRMLIERALPYQLFARTSYELGPDGVRCRIDLPTG